jgi:putative phosphoesterase
MTRVLLLSDTHGFLDPKLVPHIEDADEVWHGGDIGPLEICRKISTLKPIRAVWGNIDGQDVRGIYPEFLTFEVSGLTVLITHIGGTPGKYPAKVKAELLSRKPGLFICGHSHILKVQFDQNFQLLYMNPGAAGMHGFHSVRTALRFVVSDGTVKDLAIIELGKRGAV